MVGIERAAARTGLLATTASSVGREGRRVERERAEFADDKNFCERWPRKEEEAVSGTCPLINVMKPLQRVTRGVGVLADKMFTVRGERYLHCKCQC